MNLDTLNLFLADLEQAGWSVERKSTQGLSLNPSFSARYPDIPDEYILFLENVASCINPSRTAWFLVEDDYNGTRNFAFSWNEFESQSIEAAEEDIELITEIKHFWDQNLP